MSLIGQAIGDAIRQGLTPALKRDRYIRHGRLWYRPDPDVIPIVLIEVEKDVRANQGRFTIDLALHFRQVASTLGARPVETQPRPRDATVRINIAAAAAGHAPPHPVQIDHAGESEPRWWWKPLSDAAAQNPDQLPECLGDVWQRFATPWLAKHRDPTHALSVLIDQQQWWVAAATALTLGDPEHARTLARRALADAHPLRCRAIEQWAAAHGLDLAPQPRPTHDRPTCE